MTIEQELQQIAACHAKLMAPVGPVEVERIRLIRKAAAVDGLSRRKIAANVGLCFQRVDQIIRSGNKPAKES